ncbi:MAG: DNA-binding protein [Euryarchaeota archaeon]|nr:DNA-binding protein [Euryarchaeota archaeon]
MKISQLQPGMKKVTVDVSVVDVAEPREFTGRFGPGVLQNVIVEDDTGQCKLVLWGQDVGSLKKGDKVRLENGYTSEFRGELQIQKGRFGQLTKVK